MTGLFGDETQTETEDEYWDSELDEMAAFANASEPFEYIGHQEITQQLNSLIQKQTLPHAILFSGEEGIGKATLAKALAHSLLTGKDSIEFHFDSATFGRMEQGSHMDYLHISSDHAEGKKPVIPIDAIRNIGTFLHTTRGEAPMRVIVIDGAEHMNTNAANALLKNLEEPPSGTCIILISHNAASLLPTIHSRLRNFKFKPLEAADCASITKKALGIESDYSAKDIDLITALTDARPGLAIRWLEAGAAAMYRDWLELIMKTEQESKQLPRIAQFANDLLADRKAMHQQFEIFSNLVLLFIKRAAIMEEGSISDSEEREAIANWRSRLDNPRDIANHWFTLKQQFSLTQRLHLEYKNNLITILLRVVRGQEPLKLT